MSLRIASHSNCTLSWFDYYSVIIILWIAHLTISSAADLKHGTGPIVTIVQQGKVQGVVVKNIADGGNDIGRDYVAFRGIPYASQKRFQVAGPPETWDGVRDASNYGTSCMQMSFMTGKPEGSEDCLYINVATPSIPTEDENIGVNHRKRNTIVFIHGGGFYGGSGGQYGVEYWMNNGNVVFVTFNYRLGPFGFLNAGNDVTEANLGLKDQTAALMWVQRNIETFGGMKENVTLFGGSAGAAGVAYHLLSPMSDGLFGRAISGSGSAICAWAYDPNPRKNAKLLVQQLGCPSEFTSEEEEAMIKCLKEKPAEEFFGKRFGLDSWKLDPSAPFLPSAERSSLKTDKFLTDDPAVLLANGNFKIVPWLIGVTNQEGLALHSASIMNDPKLLDELNTNWDIIAPLTLSLEGELKSNDEFIGEKLQELYSDRNFFTGVRTSILAHAKSAPCYAYMFDYMDVNAKSWLTTILGLNISGVAHGDDFAYYFKFYMDPKDPASGIGFLPNTSASAMSKMLVKLLVAFAQDGTPKAAVWGEDWPPSNSNVSTVKWYHLDKYPTLKDESDEFIARMKFWDSIISSASSMSVGTRNPIHLEL